MSIAAWSILGARRANRKLMRCKQCKFGYSPEKDTRPVEYIHVQARFHYIASRPDEPWHITVDFGNRNTWDDGNGFFRRGYHIYAKNNDLSQGYAGYTSPINRMPVGKADPVQHRGDLPRPAQIGAEPTSVDGTEATAWVPWGSRDYFRHPKWRILLHSTIQQSLNPPMALSESRARRAPWEYIRDPTTGSAERKARPSIQDELDDLISRIRDGASKPASLGKRPNMVRDFSGRWVHVCQAVSDAKKDGKEIPVAWKAVLQNFYARGYHLKETARLFRATGARTMFDKTRRATRATTRFQNRAPKSKRLEGTQRLSHSRSKMRVSLTEGLAVPQDRPATERRQTNGSSTEKDDGGGGLKSGPRVLMESPQPGKSKAAKPGSRPKLKTRNPFDTDADARTNVSASAELDSKASREKGPGRSPDNGRFESKGRVRRIMSRPEVTTKGVDLEALLNAEADLEASIHRKEGPKATKAALGDGSARASAKRPQKSSMGKPSSDYGSPVPSGRRRSPQAPIKRSGESGASGSQKSGPDTSQDGKKPSSPLPPSDADLARKWDKRMKKSFEARRHGVAVKKAPALVLRPSAGEATF